MFDRYVSIPPAILSAAGWHNSSLTRSRRMITSRVTQVYAFDPSPVTGFFSVDPDTRDMNRRTLAIDRIYERGEILAIVRSLTSLFVAPSASQPTIRGVRYALFYPADPITGHSMTEFACRMYGAAGIGP